MNPKLNIKTYAVKKGCKILAEDLMGNTAYDITDFVEISDGKLEIPGEIISEIGTSENEKGDTSEPGLVLKVEN